MSVTGEPEGRPLKVGAALIDMVCGLYATTGVLAALQARERTGPRAARRGVADGQRAGRAAQPGLRAPDGGRRARAAWATAIRRSRRTRRSAPPTATSPWRSATTRSSRGCARAIGRPELARRSALRHERRAAGATARSSARSSRARSTASPPRRGSSGCRRPACPAGPINDVGEAFALAEALGLEPVWEVDGVRGVRSPLQLSATRPTAARRRPPALGEHDDELRAWLAAD